MAPQERYEIGKARRVDPIELFTSVLRARSREVWRTRAFGEPYDRDLPRTESRGQASDVGKMGANAARWHPQRTVCRRGLAGEQQLESNILQAISQARARSLKCESTFSQELLASTEPNRTTGVSLLVAHWPCNVAIHRRFRRPLMQADSRDTKDSLFRRHTRPPTRTALLVRGVVRSASETMYRDVVNRAVLAVHQNRPVIASS